MYKSKIKTAVHSYNIQIKTAVHVYNMKSVKYCTNGHYQQI